MTVLYRVRREVVAWGKTEGIGWIFVLKTTIAALLAMAISMRLELGQPVTAMVTVFIVMHPQTGMVLTKSFYRICGTCAGVLASLTLLGLFAQERVLFLGGLALWVGVCTAGAAIFRNFKSYGFTLSGYTAAMICLPLVMQPTGFFDYAVNRATEIVIGIICAGVVSEVAFPRSLSESMVRTMEARYAQFAAFAQAVLSSGRKPQDMDQVHLQLIGNVATLESLRSSVLPETAEIRTRDRRLRRMNAEFMDASTTLLSLCHLLNRQKNTATPPWQALHALRIAVAEALRPEGGGGSGAEPALISAQRLAVLRAELAGQEEAVRREYRGNNGNKVDLDIETALALIRRFVREMHSYAKSYAAVADNHAWEPLEDVPFATRTDPMVALLTGARAALATLLVAAFWIGSSWPFGANAVMMAAIASALFAPAPDPARAVKAALIGTVLGFVAAFSCKFLVLPSLDGIGLLCAGLAPFLMVGSYLALNPNLAVVGLGYSTMFCFMVSPANHMQYDPVVFVNFGSALMLGVASAAVTFATFAPVTGAWLKRRTARMLRGQVAIACSGRLRHLAPRFESGTRDLLHRCAARPNVQDSLDRELLGWMVAVLEVGRAAIQLRQDAASTPLPQPVIASVQESLVQIERFFSRPGAQRHSAALQAVEETIAAMLPKSGWNGADEGNVDSVRRMLTSLHLIRSSLLDEESIVTAAISRPAKIMQGEPTYAT